MALNLFTGRAIALDRVIPTTGVTQGPAAAGPYPGIYCSVFISGTTVLATLLDAGQAPRLNPFLVNTDGSFSFFGAAATYDLIFSTTVPVVRSPSLVQVPAYTFAGLPPSSALTEGNLAHVIDDDSLWIDTGTVWKQIGAAGSGTVTHVGAPNLLANRLILGNGNNDVTQLGSLGTAVTVLHGNPGGPPTFGPVNLAADVSGLLPFAKMVGGDIVLTEAQITNLVADLALKLVAADLAALHATITAETSAAIAVSQTLAPQLLKSGSGTSNAAGATVVDSIAVQLAAKDRLWITYEIESAVQDTVVPLLYSVTDAFSLVQLCLSLVAGAVTSGDVLLFQRPSGPTALRAMSRSLQAAGNSLNPAIQSDVENVTLVTNWTAPWTLGLRHGGVGAGGTFSYNWSVYKIPG